VGVSQTLRRWTEGATYVRQGDNQVGHWPTFLVVALFAFIFMTTSMVVLFYFFVNKIELTLLLLCCRNHQLCLVCISCASLCCSSVQVRTLSRWAFYLQRRRLVNRLGLSLWLVVVIANLRKKTYMLGIERIIRLKIKTNSLQKWLSLFITFRPEENPKEKKLPETN